MDVAPDELDAVADAPEDQHHLVVADRDAGLGQAAGDRHRDEQRLVELVGPDLGVEVVAGLVEGEQPLDLLGTPGDFVEVAELARRSRRCAPPARALAMTPSKSMAPSGRGSCAGKSAAMSTTVSAAAHPNAMMRLMKLSSVGNGQERRPAAMTDWKGFLWKRIVLCCCSREDAGPPAISSRPQTLPLLPDRHDLYLAERIRGKQAVGLAFVVGSGGFGVGVIRVPVFLPLLPRGSYPRPRLPPGVEITSCI